jgi:TPR repeat protein
MPRKSRQRKMLETEETISTAVPETVVTEPPTQPTTQSNEIDEHKPTRSQDQSTQAFRPLDPQDFEICHAHFVAVRCGNKEAWESLFELAVTNGCIVARIIMAICYADKEITIVPIDTTMVRRFGKDTIEWLQWHRCHHGTKPLLAAYCSYYLAEYHIQGILMDKNLEQAVPLLASAKSIPCAVFKLGHCYHLGLGLSVNTTEATRLYALAVHHQHPLALNAMGCCYQQGTGVTANTKWAFRYFHLAAKHGLAVAQLNLGNCYATGAGMDTVDQSQAIKLYHMAADQSCAGAQARLGECYRDGNGVNKDIVKADIWFRLAASQGDPIGRAGIGLKYFSEGFYKLAFSNFAGSSASGNAAGQTGLASCYMCGKGTDQCTSEALKLFRLAMDQDHADAFYQLGCYYKSGTGVDKDVGEAIRLFQLAASKGHVKALTALNSVTW